MEIKVIITGATGLVGEGVLLTCLEHPAVKEILLVSRKHYNISHPKIKECIVPDFMDLDKFAGQLAGYNACFYCAGASSIGMTEETFTKVTYDVVIPFAKTLSKINPDMVFNYVSGTRTDSTEKGKVMWARVKGRTENALMRLPFKGQYNFRPGFMKPVKGQKNVPFIYRVFEFLYPVWITFIPNWTCKMKDVGVAMINTVLKGYSKPILEVKDIRSLAKG